MKTFLAWFALSLTCGAGGIAQDRLPTELRTLFDYDAKVLLDEQSREIATVNGVRLFEISYASPKGGRVPAYLVVPAGKGFFPAILYGPWGYGTRTEFLSEALLYAEAGVVSLLVDYPWVRPLPWRKNVGDFQRPESDCEAYIQAVIDLRRGIDLLASRPDVDASRLAYVGHSSGAQWGAILSTVDRRVKTAILIGGAPSAGDIYLNSQVPEMVELRKRLPGCTLNTYLEITGTLDAVRFVPYSSPTPLLFQFARAERYFDDKSMQRYFQAAGEPKAVRWYWTGHELNDVQALIDRSAWLKDNAGFPSLGPILRQKFFQ